MANKAGVFTGFFQNLGNCLNERSRRLVVAAAAQSMPYGGVTAIAKAANVSRSVIYDGIKELQGEADARDVQSPRQRRPGAGPKCLTEKDETLIEDLNSLICPFEHGDPESNLRWTCKSLRNLRWCRHEIFAQTAKHRICRAARNEVVFFAYRVAIPRQRFSIMNAFSTKWRNLYNSLSYSRCTFRLLLGGMTTCIPSSSARLTIASES